MSSIGLNFDIILGVRLIVNNFSARSARRVLIGSISKSDAKVLLFYDMGNSLSPGLWYMSRIGFRVY